MSVLYLIYTLFIIFLLTLWTLLNISPLKDKLTDMQFACSLCLLVRVDSGSHRPHLTANLSSDSFCHLSVLSCYPFVTISCPIGHALHVFLSISNKGQLGVILSSTRHYLHQASLRMHHWASWARAGRTSVTNSVSKEHPLSSCRDRSQSQKNWGALKRRTFAYDKK